MKIVYYEYITPTTFQQPFSYDTPIAIAIKHFVCDDIVPLHYEDSIEILLCDNLIGEITIDNQSFKLGGRQVFVIPPYTVHANNIKTSDGTMYVVKISFDMLNPILNLPALFKYHGKQMSQLSYYIQEFNSLYAIVAEIIRNNDNLLLCIGKIVELFNILLKYANVDSNDVYSTENILQASELRKLINWTQHNFQNKITLEDVANYMGYSKYYFCNKFKLITGTTYQKYLESVRISHACRLLINNTSITETCFKCGFSNVSYFIKVFKKIQGLSPKQYTESFREIISEPHIVSKVSDIL